jgi:hypothetical protein
MLTRRRWTWAGVLLAAATLTAAAQQKPMPVTDPAKADADFAVQGEYAGQAEIDGKAQKLGVQVVGLGGGKFRAVLHQGGLPGDGWDPATKKVEAAGQTKDGVTTFSLLGTATIKDGSLTLAGSDGKKLGELKRVVRRSPTEGAKPPAGAVVLFDGSSADHFVEGKMTEDRLLPVPATTKQAVKDFTLHLEFRVPYQHHGNSGVYIQRTWEIQVMNSFGKTPGKGDCGALYQVKVPDVNMSYPPLSWQTFDIDFTGPRFDEAGKVAQTGRITVKHNGVAIHDNVEVPAKPTGAGKQPSAQGGPIYLQNHGSPVVYRNFWVVEKK